jgi:hypothetical protein
MPSLPSLLAPTVSTDPSDTSQYKNNRHEALFYDFK